MLTIMGIVADREKLDLNGTIVKVAKEMVTSPARRIGRLSVDIHIPAALGDEDQQRLKAAALTCPVHKSLHPDVETPITWRFGP
jgi:putative redox protein